MEVNGCFEGCFSFCSIISVVPTCVWHRVLVLDDVVGTHATAANMSGSVFSCKSH